MSSYLLLQLRKYILNNLGLNYGESREEELYKKMKEIAPEFGFKDAFTFIEWMLDKTLEPAQIRTIASYLTIGETYFQREKDALNYIEYEYLPKRIKSKEKKHINLWSAGCSSGEEPYCLAIILRKIIQDIDEWTINLRATDINPRFLDKAKKGIYSKWSFRGENDYFRNKYFDKLGDFYKIKEEIRQMVDFSYLNLVTDKFLIKDALERYDIILCRNVLIYFSNDKIKEVTEKFYDSLADNGILILSPVESNNLVCDKFDSFFKGNVKVYIKSEGRIKEYNKITKYNKTHNSYKSLMYLPNCDAHNFLQCKKNKNIRLISKKDKKSVSLTNKIDSLINDDKSYIYVQNLIKKGAYNKADEILSHFFKGKDNVGVRWLFLKAELKAIKKEFKESEDLCLKIIETDKINTSAHYLLAKVLFEQSKDDESVEILKKTLFLDPNHVLGYYLLANIFKSKGKIAESRKYFDNVIKILEKYDNDDYIVEQEGITALKFRELVDSMK